MPHSSGKGNAALARRGQMKTTKKLLLRMSDKANVCFFNYQQSPVFLMLLVILGNEK
jgi:hypothetical protein